MDENRLDMRIKIIPVHDILVEHYPDNKLCKCVRSESVDYRLDHNKKKTVSKYKFYNYTYCFDKNSISELAYFFIFVHDEIYEIHNVYPTTKLKCNDYEIVIKYTPEDICTDCMHCRHLKKCSDYRMKIEFDLGKPMYDPKPVEHLITNTYRVAKRYEIKNTIGVYDDEINGLNKINGLSFNQVLEMYKKELIATADNKYCSLCFDNDIQAEIVFQDNKYYLIRLCTVTFNKNFIYEYLIHPAQCGDRQSLTHKLAKQLVEKKSIVVT